MDTKRKTGSHNSCHFCYAGIDGEGNLIEGYECQDSSHPKCPIKAPEDNRPEDAPSRYAEAVARYAREKAPYDAVKNPPHYAQYEIQPIEYIIRNKLGYCEGNVVKYISRYNLKDGIQDLKKAREYIDILIKSAKQKGKDYDKTGD